MHEGTCGARSAQADTSNTSCLRGLLLACDSRHVTQSNPRRRMIARALLAADPGVHTGSVQPLRQTPVEQKMIDAQPGIGLPVLAEVIPESINPLARMKTANRIGPALREQTLETCAAFGLQQRILQP